MNETPKSMELSGGGFRSNVDVALLVQGGILLALYLSIFGSAFPVLYNDWFVFKQFSHGLLVPFIAGYMAWQKRKELLATPISASSYGTILIVPALIIGLAGKAIGDSFTERVGMVLCLGGLIWLMFGGPLFKQLRYPLGYLFLMIPLPYVIVNEVAFKLRIIDAAIAAPVLRLLGVPVYRDNYFLHLPNVTLEVADLCSGISSVFSLFALGGAYVFFSPMRPKLKVVAVLSTIPFAVVINLLRIILTAALSYYVSLSVLNVLIHELTGTITFFIALGLFVLLCEFLQRRLHIPAVAPSHVGPVSSAGAASSIPPSNVKRSWMPVLLAAALFTPTTYFAANVANQSEQSLFRSLSSVDAQLAGYHADDSKGPGFYKDPIADIDLSRIYSASQSPPIELYIAFKGKQQADKRLKSPRLGFPYSWNYVWIEPAQVPSAPGGQTINANWMLTQSGQNQVLVLYWFQTGERTMSGEFEKRMLQIRNVLWYGRSDAAVIRLATPVSNSDKINEAKDRLTRFAADLYPRLRDVLPL